MKKSTIIVIVAFALGIILLTTGFILLTDNNISRALFTTKAEETTTTPTTTTRPQYDAMDLFNTDITQYVTLGDYKGMTIEVEQMEASEEDVIFYINQILCIDGEYTKVREGVIEEQMIFNLDYTGYYMKNDGTKGTTFSNGAATNQLAYIQGDVFYTLRSSGVGTFVDGFAQGIIGKNVGETFDINVTFADDYQIDDLKGKTVIFEIKLNHIAQGNFTDGWVKEYTNDEYKTCEEYKVYVEETINDTLKSNNMNLLWAKIIENAVVSEIPEQEYNYWYYYFREQVEYYVLMYQMYGMNYTYEQMLTMFGFADDKALQDYAKEIVIEELITFAIIQAEGIEATDEEYRIMLDTLIEQMGKSEEEVLKTYDEKTIRQQIILNKVNDVIYDLNTFVLKAE